MTKKEFKRDLKQFRTATKQYWEHYPASGPMLRLSNGCHFVRINAGAFWLFEKVATAQQNDKIQSCSFQIWQLKRCYYDWQLECTNSIDEVLFSVNIDVIHFPVDEFTIILFEGVALLPAEYRAQYFQN